MLGFRFDNILNFSLFQKLHDVIRMTCDVIEKQDTGESKVTRKSYTYAQLKDLQSRLALVAGEQQKESAKTIRQFDEVATFNSSMQFKLFVPVT